MMTRLIAMLIVMAILGCEGGGRLKVKVEDKYDPQYGSVKEEPVEIGQQGVKIFYAVDDEGMFKKEKFQNEINTWLKEHAEKIEIIDRQVTSSHWNSVYIYYKRLK